MNNANIKHTCLKLTTETLEGMKSAQLIKTPKQCQMMSLFVFIANFEQISDFDLVFLLLPLNRQILTS